ncbi:unnamed protein product [Caenorhabditis angaria]|uniref:Endonuclease/exonuclease/phosphatase domain-containing protein n=1 Tax=Caenorhabditis angaria TaxID=860376 RepID=A0A9P1N3Z0_9PELO|nr:unnamed protein product [Caenorhabditis angaria]
MRFSLIFLSNFLIFSSFSQDSYSYYNEKSEVRVTLRVMTFNIWNSGANVENGQQKIAKHILLVNPDIVALQETYINVTQNLTRMLGPAWKSIEHPNSTYPDTVILTRQLIIPNSIFSTDFGLGCKIMLRSGPVVNVWNSHLHYASYGPYAAYNKMVTDIGQIMSGELILRAPEVLRILSLPKFQNWLQKSQDIPIIFCGDFNAPSHLDWTTQTEKMHGNWKVEWPATKLLEDAGFLDSYREIYPNVLENPGRSWSTVNKWNPEWNWSIPEPQDRIDFIFYKGPLIPFQSVLYSGYEKLHAIPNHHQNDYPSDHFAVFTDFSFIS